MPQVPETPFVFHRKGPRTILGGSEIFEGTERAVLLGDRPNAVLDSSASVCDLVVSLLTILIKPASESQERRGSLYGMGYELKMYAARIYRRRLTFSEDKDHAINS